MPIEAHTEHDTPATEAAIAALERMALEELRPGDSLPSEAGAAELLGVSRLTVREAVRALEARGLVTLQKGKRPVVRPTDGALIGDYFRTAVRRDPQALFELTQVRHALEVHIARLAARSSSRTSLIGMQSAIDDQRAAHDDAALIDADARFHEALAAGSGNSMLIHMVEALAEPMQVSRLHSLRGRRRGGRSVESVVDAHEAILDAIKRGDPEEAAEQMRRHLDDTERDLLTELRNTEASTEAFSPTA